MFHITTARPPRFLVWLAPLAVALAACESTGPGSHALSLSVTTKSATSMASATTDASGGSISLSAAQVTLKEIELKTTGTSCEAETDKADAAGTSGDEQDAQDEQNEDCAELELSPLQVNLPLDPTTQLILDALVPAGTYGGVQAKLEGVTVSGMFTPAGGTVGQPFTFTSNAEAEIEMDFPTPITVGPGTSNFTVSVDVASWFKDASGAFLDPNDPANAETINANIRHSFRAFGDEDHDGVDDDHEESGSH